MDLGRVLDGVGDDAFGDDAVERARARLVHGIHGDEGFPPRRRADSVRIPRRSRPMGARAWMPIAASVALVAAIVGGVAIGVMQSRRVGPIAATPSTSTSVVIDHRDWYQCGPVWAKGDTLAGSHHTPGGLDERHREMLNDALSLLGQPERWLVAYAEGPQLAVLAPAAVPGAFGADFSYARVTDAYRNDTATWTPETGTCSLQKAHASEASHPYEVLGTPDPSSRMITLLVLTFRCSPHDDDYTARVVESDGTVEITVREDPVGVVELLCLPSDPRRIEVTARLREPIGDRVLIRPGQVSADQVFGAPPG